LAAFEGAKYLLDRFTTVTSTVCTGWEFLSRAPLGVDERAFVFVMSYSGQTPEVVQSKELALSRGARVIAISNTTETPLAQGLSDVLDYQSKAVYTAPLAIAYLLAAHVMRARGESVETADEIIAELPRLPQKVAAVIERTREQARELAAQCADAQMFYVLGAGPLYGLAYKLSLSVVIENLWLDAAPVDAGEFYHGPIEIVPPRGAAQEHRVFLHLVGTDASRTVSEQAIAFCRQKGARQLIYDVKDYPEFGELFAPFALFVPTEWFIMYMAAQKNHDVDERRYMGKIGARWGEYGDA
jgi:fructoselysine-6-P-deglycase FrlB-like protein